MGDGAVRQGRAAPRLAVQFRPETGLTISRIPQGTGSALGGLPLFRAFRAADMGRIPDPLPALQIRFQVGEKIMLLGEPRRLAEFLDALGQKIFQPGNGFAGRRIRRDQIGERISQRDAGEKRIMRLEVFR